MNCLCRQWYNLAALICPIQDWTASMANPLVECIPNFSEGRRSDVINAIVAAITGSGAVRLLDTSSDADHNRTVVTFVGNPEAVENAAYAGIKAASRLIDLDIH